MRAVQGQHGATRQPVGPRYPPRPGLWSRSTTSAGRAVHSGRLSSIGPVASVNHSGGAAAYGSVTTSLVCGRDAVENKGTFHRLDRSHRAHFSRSIGGEHRLGTGSDLTSRLTLATNTSGSSARWGIGLDGSASSRRPSRHPEPSDAGLISGGDGLPDAGVHNGIQAPSAWAGELCTTRGPATFRQHVTAGLSSGWPTPNAPSIPLVKPSRR